MYKKESQIKFPKTVKVSGIGWYAMWGVIVVLGVLLAQQVYPRFVVKSMEGDQVVSNTPEINVITQGEDGGSVCVEGSYRTTRSFCNGPNRYRCFSVCFNNRWVSDGCNISFDHKSCIPKRKQ